MSEINRMPLRYPGSKGRLAMDIIRMMPPHTLYCEPFAGGGIVALRKPPAAREVINDLNGDVINFFRVLRNDTRRLIRAIRWTPFSRAELRAAWAYDGDDSLERARTFYVKCWQSWGSGAGRDQSGWRFQVASKRAAITDWNRTKHLNAVADRLKRISIEQDDALKVIERYDTPATLFYVDPPYLHSTRMKDSMRKGYRFEMTDEDHIVLAEVLRSRRGMVMLSGHPSALYNDLYAGWRCYSFDHYTINRSRLTTECIWMSPNCFNMELLPLFAGIGEVE